MNGCNFNGSTLTNDVFKGFSFREVIMFNNDLSAVAADAFDDSIHEMTLFEFTDPITDFPLRRLTFKYSIHNFLITVKFMLINREPVQQTYISDALYYSIFFLIF